MESILERPTKTEQRMAQQYLEAVSKLADYYSKTKKSVALEVADHGSIHLEFSPKVFRLLEQILTITAQGKAFSLIPADSEIGTQQAAEMLNVSRPHIVKLLESGEIPFYKVGKHRRIKLEDILVYKDRFEKIRERALQELADQAQELGMGY